MMQAESRQGVRSEIGIVCGDDEFRFRRISEVEIAEVLDRQVVDDGVLDIVLNDSLDRNQFGSDARGEGIGGDIEHPTSDTLGQVGYRVHQVET
ncbi:hypothetical protein [Rhodococcus pyridinivorans]|uniref:hypothetical protein n=1 Tax=Rhodococcus pyridinivorans TaxID=103816 RepID=UPI000ABB5C07|nr:hypothetical protein [Rhodococcus pyridinivorans]